MNHNLWFIRSNNIWALDQQVYDNNDSELLERMKRTDKDDAYIAFRFVPAKDDNDRKIIDQKMLNDGFTAIYKQFNTENGAVYICPSVDGDNINQKYFISQYMITMYGSGVFADMYYIKQIHK